MFSFCHIVWLLSVCFFSIVSMCVWCVNSSFFHFYEYALWCDLSNRFRRIMHHGGINRCNKDVEWIIRTKNSDQDARLFWPCNYSVFDETHQSISKFSSSRFYWPNQCWLWIGFFPEWHRHFNDLISDYSIRIEATPSRAHSATQSVHIRRTMHIQQYMHALTLDWFVAICQIMKIMIQEKIVKLNVQNSLPSFWKPHNQAYQIQPKFLIVIKARLLSEQLLCSFIWDRERKVWRLIGAETSSIL